MIEVKLDRMVSIIYRQSHKITTQTESIVNHKTSTSMPTSVKAVDPQIIPIRAIKNVRLRTMHQIMQYAILIGEVRSRCTEHRLLTTNQNPTKRWAVMGDRCTSIRRTVRHERENLTVHVSTMRRTTWWDLFGKECVPQPEDDGELFTTHAIIVTAMSRTSTYFFRSRIPSETIAKYTKYLMS
jgi:hypothetical protein